jgi:type II secretory pathway pseudopilin PulG
MKTAVFNPSRQSGATLVMALIVLIVLMILGVSAVITANSQFKMAGNLQFENQAKNNAENQLARAEVWLAANVNAASPCFPGNAPAVYDGKDFYQITTLGCKIVPPGGSSSTGAPGSGNPVKINLFQITGHGSSARGASRDVISVYQVRL